jgi:ribosomal protein S18 acetylase RimI-like enzyme
MTAIRRIQENDAEGFLKLCRALDEETAFMLLEPGERQTAITEERERIERLLAKDNQTILVAEEGGRFVGYVAASGGRYARNHHCAYLVMGVLQSYAGQGIGTRLFEEIETWARQQGLRRLELTVMAHNRAGVALYQKRGFEIEGTRRHSLFVKSEPVDEYYMGKLLD